MAKRSTKPSPTTLLRERLAERLAAARAAGQPFPTLRELTAGDEASEKPAEKAVLSAAGAKQFPGILANKKDFDSPLAAAEDLAALAASDRLLDYALAQTPPQPGGFYKDTDLLKAVTHAQLKAAFKQRLAKLAAEPNNRFFSGKIEDALAPRLIEILRQADDEGATPLTLKALAERANLANLAERTLLAAAKKQAFTRVAVLANKKIDGLVLLKENLRDLVWKRPLGEWVAATVTDKEHAVGLPQLTKTLGNGLNKTHKDALKKELAERLEQSWRHGQLPAGLGAIRVKSGPLLFRLSDVRPAPSASATPTPSPVAMPSAHGQAKLMEFPHRFEQAFARLDAEKRANLVSLHDLRTALSEYPRETFDAALKLLRKPPQFRLTGVQGGPGTTPEMIAAGIQESGDLFLFVARRSQ